uniref:Uncharacterized protein n=1 Tax=Arundo donax TaxID=35708 RepID=A0A0A8YJ27_ARUDO
MASSWEVAYWHGGTGAYGGEQWRGEDRDEEHGWW